MIRSLSWTFFIIGPIGLLSFDTFAISSEDDEKARQNSSLYAFSRKPREDSIAPKDLNKLTFTTSGA